MHREMVGALFWTVIGILFSLGSLQYGFQGSPGIPGSGFVPLLGGLVLLSLSLVLLVSTAITGRASSLAPPPDPVLPGRDGLKRIVRVVVALCFYVLALYWLGFLATTFCFMVMLLTIERRRLRIVVPVALVSAGFFYALFKALLGVPLPGGVVGF